MEKILAFFIMVVALSQTQAQEVIKDSEDKAASVEPAKHDSLRKAMMIQIEERKRAMAIYGKMMHESPKKAMDSIVQAKKHEYSADGLRRLQALMNNTRVDTLKTIDLTYAGLDEIPEFVFDAKELEVLILDYNNIKRLPKELGTLRKLNRVYWRSNSLDDFWWIRIGKIDQIERLDLSYNTLTRLPRGVKKLTGLKELVLDENLFDEVPVNRLSDADFLETVSFNKSPNLKISENNYGKLGFLKVIKINNCGLKSIDPSFYEINGVEEVQLQENKLDSLPDGISSWENLSKLSFYKNDLKSLPTDFFDLKKLVVVDLYFNELEVIPEAIGKMTSLEILYLASNKIYDVPESIGKLTNLEELYLHRNRLSAVPASLSSLSKLRVLRVNENYLVDFPTQVLDLKALEDLDISDNQLMSIPAGVESLSKLKLFTYANNPVDFDAPQNLHLARAIVRMMEAGTICAPRIYLEEVAEPGSVTQDTSKVLN